MLRDRINSGILIHPVVLYSAVWLGGLLLVWTGWAYFMTPVSRKFAALVTANIGVSILAYFLARSVTIRRAPSGSRKPEGAPRSTNLSPAVLSALRRYSDVLFAVWAVGSVINVCASGGLPIVWIMRGNYDRSYADFGLPTFSGLIGACGLFASLGYFLLQRLGHTRKRWWAIALVFVYQIATLNRGAVIWMIVELIAVYLQIDRFGFRRMLGALTIILVVIVLFGHMGDIRSRRHGTLLESMGTGQAVTVFRKLPSGFWWTYLYASVGVVNLNAAVDSPNLVPLGHFHWSVAGLFPTVVRKLIYTETAYELRYPLEMVISAFNVFTIYGGYLADFGMIGCVVITFVLQLVAGHYFVKARDGDVASILAYAICVQIIVVSLFTDSLTSWVALFQFILAFFFRYFAKSVSRRFVASSRRSAILTSVSARSSAVKRTGIS
jgi:oligosaccharide repeat unit polymerase